MLSSGLNSNKWLRAQGFRGKAKRLIIPCLLLPASCFLLLTSAIGAESVPVIENIAVEGIHSITGDELLYLLDLKAGDAIDPLRIRNGIKRAFLKGIFEDIEIYAEGGMLRVVVRERDFIKKIRISGNTYLSDSVIKGHFPMKEGQVMRYDLIEGSIEKLKQALSERGFHHAVVNIDVVKDPEPYRVDIAIRVDEGQPEIIKRIVIHGPMPVAEEARSIMKTTEGDVYDQFQLRSDMDRIRRYYKKHGYINPSVGPYTFAEGELDINIDPGKKLLISFHGNSAISSNDLLKEMPFFDAGDFRDDLVEEAVVRVTGLYHTRGYPSVQVAPVTSIDEDIRLNFFIFEGDRVTVGSIRFSGVTIPEGNLKEMMFLREGEVYNPDMLSADRDAITEFYYALGYLEVDVHEPEVRIEKSVADITVAVKEGIQTVVDAITIDGARSIAIEEIERTIGIKKGDPYNEVDISDARYRVVELYLEHGFADATVDVKREFGRGTARIAFDIKEGTQTFFGRTIITGNKTTRREVVERDLLHREGAPFNYSILSKERQRLYRLGLFTDVIIEPVDRYDSQRDIIVDVREGNAGAVEFGIGYGDYERYRGFVDLGYRNLFGMNRQGSLRAEVSSLEERYIINYYDPWFLNRPIPLRAVLMREERTEKNIDTGEIRYKLRRHTATAGFERRIGANLKGEIYYEFSLVKTFDVKPDVILTKEDTGTLAISSIRPGIIYDTRDNPFDPKSGVLAGITMKVASGILLSETDFAKVMFNSSVYNELGRRFVLAASLRGGIAQGFGSTRELPLVERFFLGGRSTVRGYEQDTLGPKGTDGTPTGGNAFLMANLELRTSLGKGIGIVTFIDGGNVWVKANKMNLAFKYTAGLGLRYSTPVGPLRIDYGYKLMRETGESHGEIHFSIGQAF